MDLRVIREKRQEARVDGLARRVATQIERPMAKLHVSHILVQHRYQAEDLKLKLDAGVSFSELAKKFSSCSSAQQGGDLGVVDTAKLDPDFAEAAGKLSQGQVSGIIRTRFGFHLIKVLG